MYESSSAIEIIFRTCVQNSLVVVIDPIDNIHWIRVNVFRSPPWDYPIFFLGFNVLQYFFFCASFSLDDVSMLFERWEFNNISGYSLKKCTSHSGKQISFKRRIRLNNHLMRIFSCNDTAHFTLPSSCFALFSHLTRIFFSLYNVCSCVCPFFCCVFFLLLARNFPTSTCCLVLDIFTNKNTFRVFFSFRRKNWRRSISCWMVVRTIELENAGCPSSLFSWQCWQWRPEKL